METREPFSKVLSPDNGADLITLHSASSAVAIANGTEFMTEPPLFVFYF